MNSTVKKLFFIIIIFALIIACSFVISDFFMHKDDTYNNTAETDTLHIVTSFYPMYVIALNLTDGVDGVDVVNLTPNQTGCLHDYQFNTADMKKLSNADAFIINGGGMETFIMDVVKQYPDMDIIDSSTDVNFLTESSGHHHDHDEEDAHEDEDSDSDEEYNSHAWLNTDNYMIQIENIRDGFIELDPENADKYRTNADIYLEKISEIADELHTLSIPGDEGVIIFHDAFAYLADEIGLTISAAIEVDNENSSLSSGEIASIIDEMNEKNIKYIFVEAQFSTKIADTIAAQTGAKVYVLDSIVTGSDSKDAYIDAMKSNIEILKSIF